ncbi:peptidoglycan editing factor PgeF [[Pseudomonas] carboxydohydrogena]|uniref:Purine nucleoside phosphorylase n=1 Tax=Afipia carboxydohydrogena TaxID=290 RepID=A0ABY8BR48_AFICR|nr:peptidoglycan editing factor PgeF [[Pseudomonas] carboxydohydrogena]WEF51165.1 peptidoglycan editing factor PgeF [[Pseudomonas] carboxydohydrogena]
MIVTSSLLSELPGLRHAFFTREGGVSKGIYGSLNGGLGSKDDPTRVHENRRRMAQALDVEPSHFLTVYQVHSPDVAIVTAPWPNDERPHADALVTRTPGLAIGITTADCGPVLFADPKARVIGAAHAGWKGALSGVVEATLKAMETLGARRQDIRAAIGPLIRQPSYEVGAEFVERFSVTDADNARYFIPSSRPDHAMFDLAGFIRTRLARAGIEALDDVGIDTYADPRFFSYRRTTHRAEPDYGRNIHALVLD